MPIKKLKDHLDGEKIKYVTISHSPAFTAMEVAESAHVPGRALAKTVMVKLDGRMAMAVLPSTRKVDLNLLRESAGAEEAKLATEAEFKSLAKPARCRHSAICMAWRFMCRPAWPRTIRLRSTPARTRR